MALNFVGGAGPASISSATPSPRAGSGGQPFGKVLDAQTKGSVRAAPSETAPQSVRGEVAPQARAAHRAVAGTTRSQPVTQAPATPSTRASLAARTVDRVASAQSKMDEILELAQSGKSFSPAELLSLQTQAYRASQEIDLAGKVVEKATGGLKQILQTQV